MTSNDRDDLPESDGATGPESAPEEASRSLPSPAPKAKRKALPVWLESILLLVLALVLAVVIKAFFVQAFYIPSESMEPGLIKNDRILVQKVSYWGSGTPERGDVVVFKDPDNWLSFTEESGPSNIFSKALTKVGLYPTGGHLVKRVIGIPGDTVECCDSEGRLSINGQPIDESEYIAQSDGCAAPMVQCKLRPTTIPDGYLLVMGDNREHSADSTAHMCRNPKAEQCPPTRGLVPIENVVGKVWALIWPANRFDKLSRPEVFEDVPDPQ
ncbi:signal peptidase I [Nocardioides dubius]|uniref:signal peptidase I n=1 Tax=Nocardioides dubius TaxID=317019 RepID=UPI0031D4DA07